MTWFVAHQRSCISFIINETLCSNSDLFSHLALLKILFEYAQIFSEILRALVGVITCRYTVSVWRRTNQQQSTELPESIGVSPLNAKIINLTDMMRCESLSHTHQMLALEGGDKCTDFN